MTEFRTGYGAAWLDLLASLTGRYLPTTRPNSCPTRTPHAGGSPSTTSEPTGTITDADLAALRALREALHRTAAATVRGDRPTDADLRVIDRALADDRPGRLRQPRRRGRRPAAREPARTAPAKRPAGWPGTPPTT